MAESPIKEITIREINANVSATLSAVAAGTPHSVTHGRARSRYVTLLPTRLLDQLVELAGEQGKLLLECAAAEPGQQLEVIRVA